MRTTTEKSLFEAEFAAIDENYREITCNIAEAAIKSGRRPGDITLMAVTKTVQPALINHALSLGIGLIGENKVQELMSKLKYLNADGVDKHIIGHLQSNKVRKITGTVSMIQSLDSVSLADEISLRSANANVETDVLLEVNIGAEASKTGFTPQEAIEKAAEIACKRNIRVRGLMAVPPVCETQKETRAYFEKMRYLFDDLKTALKEYPEPDVLSLGMSSDYVSAILEGSTLVRIGSALFGARRY